MPVRVVHGANEQSFDFQAITVGTIRRSLRDVFNISGAAVALISGVAASDDDLVECGDAVEFHNEQGRKGLGDLLSPEALRQAWQITAEEYTELLTLGLPSLQLRSGVRHPESAVDEFFRKRALQKQSDGSQVSFTERVVTAIEQVAARLPNLAGPPMTVEQVAQFASVSVKTIYRWVSLGRLKPKSDGSRPLLFERAEVEKTLSHGAGA